MKPDHALPQPLLLHPLIWPLRMISAASALVFVLGVTFEILRAHGTSTVHLKLLLGVTFALASWAMVELWIGTRKIDNNVLFKRLHLLLGIQLLLPVLRAVLLDHDSAESTSKWIKTHETFTEWHFGFLIPYALLMFLIHQALVQIYSMNERNRAKAREDQMLVALNAMAMARDNETGNHILRTQHFVKRLAERLSQSKKYQSQINSQYIELVFKAAPLHDVGKVGVPDHILHKQGKLDPDEWEIMKTHTNIGDAILSSAIGAHLNLSDDVLLIARQIASGHHEKWDGSGYPLGLKGEQIPLAARIMALADVYDALVSERVYKKRWTHEDTTSEIITKRGSHFDPDVVDAFIAESTNFKAIAERYRDD